MDIHRQKLRPAYVKVRTIRALDRKPGKPGPKPGSRSNNIAGRPPKLTGLEDRPMYQHRAEVGTGVFVFNRFMRPIIVREFNRVFEAAGGVLLAAARFCPRRMDRLYGTVYSIQTRFGELFAQIVVEKHITEVRLFFNVEAFKQGEFLAAQGALYAAMFPWPKEWPIYIKHKLPKDWDGDISQHVEPEGTWPGDRGNAAKLRDRLIKLMQYLARDTEVHGLPDLSWRF